MIRKKKPSGSSIDVPIESSNVELYPQDFSNYDQIELPEQLKMWIA